MKINLFEKRKVDTFQYDHLASGEIITFSLPENIGNLTEIECELEGVQQMIPLFPKQLNAAHTSPVKILFNGTDRLEVIIATKKFRANFSSFEVVNPNGITTINFDFIQRELYDSCKKQYVDSPAARDLLQMPITTDIFRLLGTTKFVSCDFSDVNAQTIELKFCDLDFDSNDLLPLIKGKSVNFEETNIERNICLPTRLENRNFSLINSKLKITDSLELFLEEFLGQNSSIVSEGGHIKIIADTIDAEDMVITASEKDNVMLIANEQINLGGCNLTGAIGTIGPTTILTSCQINGSFSASETRLELTDCQIEGDTTLSGTTILDNTQINADKLTLEEGSILLLLNDSKITTNEIIGEDYQYCNDSTCPNYQDFVSQVKPPENKPKVFGLLPAPNNQK